MMPTSIALALPEGINARALDEIYVGGQSFYPRRETTIDIRLDPRPERARDGVVAIIAIIGDRVLELWVSNDASLTKILDDLRETPH